MRPCYNEYGDIISHLTQWDTNRIITIRDFEYDIVPIVHFAHINDEKSLVVTGDNVTLNNNELKFKVPNILLQSYENIVINIFIYQDNGDNGIGINVENIILPVRQKPKPNDYVYADDEELIELSTFENRLQNAIKEAQTKVDEAIKKLDQAGTGNLDAVSITEATIGTDKSLHFTKSNGEETVIKGLPITDMGVDKTTGNLYYQTSNNNGVATRYSIANTNFVKGASIELGVLYITTSDGIKTKVGTVNSSTGDSGSSVTVSITNAHIDESNHLIFTMSDGSTIDAGEITGLGNSGDTSGTGGSDVVSLTNVRAESEKLYFDKSDGSTITINGSPIKSIGVFQMQGTSNKGCLCYTTADGEQIVVGGTKFVKDVTIGSSGDIFIQKSDNVMTKIGNINTSTSKAEEYGVCYNPNTQSPALQRIGASVGMVADIGIGSDRNVANYFDNVYPWSDMKRCTMTADGTITAYKGDVNYTEDGSIGNVMVEIPKFYIKRVVDENNGYIYRYICREKLEGYRLPEGFIRNGKECDKIYVAAYPSSVLNDKYSSVAGADIENDVISDIYTNISIGHKIADNWHCLDLQTLEILQTLFIIEFATLNSKSVFQGCSGYGSEYAIDTEYISKDTNIVSVTGLIDERNFYVGQVLDFTNAHADYTDLRTVENVVIEDIETTAEGVKRKATITLNASVNIKSDTIIWEWIMTGQCNNVTVSSGLCGKGLDNCVPFVYRGIENLYGGIELLIEGVKITQDGYFVTNDISTYGDITKPTADSANYKLLSYDFPRNSNRPVEGYIDKLGVDDNVPYALLPESSNGSSDTAYCDIFTGGNTIIKASECRILCSFYTNGLFGCNIAKDCDSTVTMSGRLVYAKEAV